MSSLKALGDAINTHSPTPPPDDAVRNLSKSNEEKLKIGLFVDCQERICGLKELGSEMLGYVEDSDAEDYQCVGLDVTCGIDSGTIGLVRKSTVANEDSKKNKNNGVASERKAFGEGTRSEDVLDHTPTAIKIDQLRFGHKVEHTNKCLQNYYSDKALSITSKARAGKLYNEVTSGVQEETIPITGSCIVSQQPNELSQAFAIDVVDKLLSDNDVGSSKFINHENVPRSSSPPVPSAKGCHSMAKWAHNRSAVEKSEIFDWADNIAVGDRSAICYGRKNHFSTKQVGAQKKLSGTMKPRHLASSAIGASVLTNRMKEVEDLIPTNINNLTFFDSKLSVEAPVAKELDVSEIVTEDFEKEKYEQLSSIVPEQQADAIHAGDALEMYDIGPNTQMAAEAMEALFHGSPINHEVGKIDHTENLTEDSSKGMSVVKTQNNPVRKRVCSNLDLEGNIGKSKQRKVASTKLSKGSSRSFKVQYSNSRLKKRKMMVKDIYNLQPLNTRNSPNASKSTDCLKQEKERHTREGTFLKEANKCVTTQISNMQRPVTKRVILGDLPSNAAPIAFQTRQSKSLKFSKWAETSFNKCQMPVNRLLDVSSPGDEIGEPKLVADGSKLLSYKRKGPRKEVNQVAKIEKSIGRYCEVQDTEKYQKEELKTTSVTFIHPKRRRTHRITSDNMNNTSLPVDDFLASIAQSTSRQGRNDMVAKSPADVLNAVRRKKRSTSTRKRSIASTLGTKASFTSPLVEPYLEMDSTEMKPVCSEVGSVTVMNNITSLINHPVHIKEVASVEQGMDPAYVAQDIKVKAIIDGSFGSKFQAFDVACSTPLKSVSSVSPISNVQGCRRTSHKKGSQKMSIARELLRVRSIEEASPCLLKDSRRRKNMGSIRVLFSNHLNEATFKQQKKILARLGVPIASSTSDATHFVADKFARTKNMLEVMAMGKPVVTPMWLKSCGVTSYFIDEKKYILRDLKKEKEIGFSMPASLDRACQCPLLQGKGVFITPNVKPDRELVTSLVKATHGQAVESIWSCGMKDAELSDDILVISCEEDYSICSSLLEKGTKVFSSELLLNGIVVQKLQFERYRLFSNHGKKNRSTTIP